MLFKVAICDDEEKDIQVIQRFLHIYEMQHDIDFEINTFQNSTKLFGKNMIQQEDTIFSF